jgi:signal transduction histidine kinase
MLASARTNRSRTETLDAATLRASSLALIRSEYVIDFGRAPSALHAAQGSLGLGLAIVRNLVELHGGTVIAHGDGDRSRCAVRRAPAGG